MEPKIPIRDLAGTKYVSLSGIEFLEADGSYVVFHFTDGKRKTVTGTLKRFYCLLKPYNLFCPVHRSYIVNIDEINGFDNHHFLTMNSTTPVPITEKGREELSQMGFLL